MSYIDYEGEAHENEPPSSYSNQDLANYWLKQWYDTYKVGHVWRIKETTLLSKLSKRYDPEQLVKTMDVYIQGPPAPLSFGHFFGKVDEIWAVISEEDKGYSWS